MDYYKLLTDYLKELHSNNDIDVMSFEDKGTYLLVSYYTEPMFKRENEVIGLFDLLTFVYSKI